MNNTIQKMDTDEYFIGLRKYSESGKWRWISNNSTVNASEGKFPWATGEPSGDNKGYCVVMYKEYKNNFGLYNDLSCTTTRGFICEIPTHSSGKEGMSHKSYIEETINRSGAFSHTSPVLCIIREFIWFIDFVWSFWSSVSISNKTKVYVYGRRKNNKM